MSIDLFEVPDADRYEVEVDAALILPEALDLRETPWDDDEDAYRDGDL